MHPKDDIVNVFDSNINVIEPENPFCLDYFLFACVFNFHL